MACEFMFYKDEEKKLSYPYMYCRLNGKRCIYSKKCLKEERYVPNGDLWKDCFIMANEKKNHIPKGSFYVQCYRPNNKGKLFLYVVVDEKVVKILSDFEKIDQDYVYLRGSGDAYVASLTPFPKIEEIEISKDIEEEEEVKPTPKKRQPKKKVDEEIVDD